MPRQMPTTPGPRIRAQARGGSLLLTFPIGGRGSRHRRPLPDRPPTLQAFRSVLSETTSVSTQRLINGSRSYLRRHGVQSRGAAISYHKLTLSVYRKFCCARKAWRRTGRSPIPTPLRPLRSLRRKSLKETGHLVNVRGRTTNDKGQTMRDREIMVAVNTGSQTARGGSCCHARRRRRRSRRSCSASRQSGQSPSPCRPLQMSTSRQ